VVVVSTAVVVVSTGEAFVVANSVQCEADTCSAAAVSTAAAFVVTVLAVVFVAAVLVTVITDSIMMSSSSTTSAFRGGGPGAIRTDITVPTITRTVTIGTAGTVTKATPVMNTATAADQGIFGVCGGGDKRARDGGVQACLRKPFFAADFAKVISHVTAPHHQLVAAEREGSAGKVATHSKGEKVYTIGLTILVAVSSSLVRGSPDHPWSGSAKSHTRAIAAG